MFPSVLKDADDKEKVSYILLWSGEKGQDLYNSWTPRLQRILLHLQPYDCVFNKYLPGKEMVTANALSCLSPLDGFEVSDMNVKVHHLIRITPAKMEELKEETAKDETLQLLSHKVIQGWPDGGKKIIVPMLKPYWPLRDDISVEDGLILLGSRVIVPESLRGNIFSMEGIWYRKMQTMSKILCLLAKRIQSNRQPSKFMLCLPEVPQFSTKGAYDTIRDPFKTMANIERRPVLRPKVLVPHSCRLLFQVPICQKASQPHNRSHC